MDLKKSIIIAGCLLAILAIAYMIRCGMLRRDITKIVGESDQLKEDLSKLNMFELKFLNDVTASMMEAPAANGLNPKLEELAKDEKWKSIQAKTNGLKSYGLKTPGSKTTTTKK